MNASNKSERIKARFVYAGMFCLTLLVIGVCGIMSIVTAQKGIAMLELKKSEYDVVFKKQVEFNFQIEELFRDLNNLKMKRRSTSEHKHMQQIITEKRTLIENELSDTNNTDPKFSAYCNMMDYIKYIQSLMDELDAESRERESNMEQLEKCRTKYQELTKNKVKKQ